MLFRTDFAFEKCVTLEVPVDSLSNREFKFKEKDSLLDNKKIVGFTVVPATAVKSPKDQVIVADAIAKKAYLVLQDKATKLPVKDFPLAMLFDTTGMAVVQVKGDYDFTQSFVKLSDTTGAATGQVFVFLFFYVD